MSVHLVSWRKSARDFITFINLLGKNHMLGESSRQPLIDNNWTFKKRLSIQPFHDIQNSSP
jgi:hypothetical protein